MLKETDTLYSPRGVHVGVCDGKIVVRMSRTIKAILLNYISVTLLNSMTEIIVNFGSNNESLFHTFAGLFTTSF